MKMKEFSRERDFVEVEYLDDDTLDDIIEWVNSYENCKAEEEENGIVIFQQNIAIYADLGTFIVKDSKNNFSAYNLMTTLSEADVAEPILEANLLIAMRKFNFHKVQLAKLFLADSKYNKTINQEMGMIAATFKHVISKWYKYHGSYVSMMVDQYKIEIDSDGDVHLSYILEMASNDD